MRFHDSNFREALSRVVLPAILLWNFACFLVQPNALYSQQQTSAIWSPVSDPTGSQAGACYFRKKFTLLKPEQAELIMDVADRPDVFINGRLVDWSASQIREDGIGRVDVSQLMQPGVNLIAVSVAQQRNQLAGMGLRLRVKEIGEVKWRSLTTDDSWVTRNEPVSSWQLPSHDDVTWLRAKKTGAIMLAWSSRDASDSAVRGTINGLPVSAADAVGSGSKTSQRNLLASAANGPAQMAHPQTDGSKNQQTNGPRKTAISLSDDPTTEGVSHSAPASRGAGDSNPSRQDKLPHNNPTASSNMPSRTPPQPANEDESTYSLAAGFKLQQLMPGEECGSILAMAFDEFGQLVFSKEGGGLHIVDLSIPFGQPRTALLTDEITNVQGILPLNGKIYATGQGPEGLALYEIVKDVNKSSLKVNRTLAKFKGQVGEHGPHGITLGPEGMLYVVIGNHSGVVEEPGRHSPYQNGYDADLVPRYEDPGGHALGVRAPGGTVVRVSLDGKRIETVAGGLRNVYDIAFDSHGELFAHESDMESDVGLAWYRPTTLFHVTPGADLGWRSGWSQMPSYYLDTIAPIAEFGRGSPAGIVSYQHNHFPEKYRDCLFLADWSEGRIIATHLNRDGATYGAKSEVFLSGKPLNVTDLDVGEDGSLYFCTGGRGTQGGIFRISWTGNSPSEKLSYRDDVDRALRHPQPNSAWARQNLALIRKAMGNKWSEAMLHAALDSNQPVDLRCRAIDLHFLYGGPIDKVGLESLLNDSNEALRAKATWLIGLGQENCAALNQVLTDKSPLVQRVACEALLRHPEKTDVAKIMGLLKTNDRTVKLAARRVLELVPDAAWCQSAIESQDLGVFLHGSLAVVNAHPSLAASYDILARSATTMQGFVRDADFQDMLRLIQLALVRGQVDPENVPAFQEQLYEEFPTTNALLNRELVRILAYLNAGDPEQKYAEYLKNHKDDIATKILVAMCLSAKAGQLNDETRLAVIDFLESSTAKTSAGTYRLYLVRCIRETAETLTTESIPQVLERGGTWPHALVPIFYKLPAKPDGDLVPKLMRLDRDLALNNSDAAKHSRLGLIALLAQSQSEEGMEYLRSLWRSEESRRSDLAIGLAQNPEGQNWNYLVASLPILDDMSCQEVLQKLQTVSLRPVEPKYYRQVLELGYRLQGDGAIQAAKLIKHWSNDEITNEGEDWRALLESWKTWYSTKWPEETPVNTQATAPSINVSLESILDRINSSNHVSPERGLLVFEQANCVKCHRVGVNGQSTGPDLTGLAKRFSKRETLESIVSPDSVVSDRYRSTLVLTTTGDQLLGLKVDENPTSLSLLTNDGRMIKVQKNEIEESRIVERSSMPADSLKGLSLDQIADLFAFLYNDVTPTAGLDLPQSSIK